MAAKRLLVREPLSVLGLEWAPGTYEVEDEWWAEQLLAAGAVLADEVKRGRSGRTAARETGTAEEPDGEEG